MKYIATIEIIYRKQIEFEAKNEAEAENYTNEQVKALLENPQQINDNNSDKEINYCLKDDEERTIIDW